MEMRDQEHQEVLASKRAQRPALQMREGWIGGNADLSGVGEGVLHTLPDIAGNFDAVAARP